MASLVEVTTSKPRVTEVTVKLSAGEARDVQTFISDWFSKNFLSAARAKTHPVYAAIQQALDGDADPSVMKIAKPVF